MNVFVLCTGRCGSTTFAKACEHITNYTVGHESRANMIGEERLNYPDNHIEIDNRLAWFLEELDAKYKTDNVEYFHLRRNLEDVIASYAKRMDRGIMKAYKEGVLLGSTDNTEEEVARDYVQLIRRRISRFQERPEHGWILDLENIKKEFSSFWGYIEAEGDLGAALIEWDTKHNATEL